MFGSQKRKNLSSVLSKAMDNRSWLFRYFLERGASSFLKFFRFVEDSEPEKHLIFIISNHFEPGWLENGTCGIDEQLRRLEKWKKRAFSIGSSIIDHDGTKFRHTYFFPAEQYERRLLEHLVELRLAGLGEAEIHLHHGVDKPDTAENLRRLLVNFRDTLAEEHKLLSRWEGKGQPMYAFVHGNLALANVTGGKFCGVDSEMKILQETGCYADMTLPSAPDRSQVPVINKIYECALPLEQRAPHREAIPLKVFASRPTLPLIFQGPLILSWPLGGSLLPKIENGCLSNGFRNDARRLKHWIDANIIVEGRPEWIFIKLFCHGFFDSDIDFCIGEEAKRFFSEILEYCDKSGHKVHFTTAREAVNIALAAVDGFSGNPNDFRDYKLKSISS